MNRVVHLSAACLVATAVFVTVTRAAGDSPLIKAVKANDVQAARTLIKSGANVNAKGGDGSTPLLWAANNGSVELARALVGAKATVDTPNDFGVTPLLQASRVGDAAMVDYLLRAGALGRAAVNVAASVALCLASVALGHLAGAALNGGAVPIVQASIEED